MYRYAELADADVLARFIVPSLERMALPGRTAALTYLKRHWPRLKESAPLCAALKSARFVDTNAGGGTNAAGLLKSPGELYDPEVDLLAAVFRGGAVHVACSFTTELERAPGFNPCT